MRVLSRKPETHRIVHPSAGVRNGTGEFGGIVIGLDGKPYRRRDGGGGHRGPLDTAMKLRRVGSTIAKITGLEPDAAEKQTEIRRLIDELLASIQSAVESN